MELNRIKKIWKICFRFYAVVVREKTYIMLMYGSLHLIKHISIFTCQDPLVSFTFTQNEKNPTDNNEKKNLLGVIDLAWYCYFLLHFVWNGMFTFANRDCLLSSRTKRILNFNDFLIIIQHTSLRINIVRLLNILMKCKKFDKQTWEGFL